MECLRILHAIFYKRSLYCLYEPVRLLGIYDGQPSDDDDCARTAVLPRHSEVRVRAYRNKYPRGPDEKPTRPIRRRDVTDAHPETPTVSFLIIAPRLLATLEANNIIFSLHALDVRSFATSQSLHYFFATENLTSLPTSRTLRLLEEYPTHKRLLPLGQKGTIGFGMLLGMLISWVMDGKPHYASMDPDQHIAYISDIGAQRLKPLFIAGSVVTVVTFDLAFISERWLRHAGRLAHNTSKGQVVLSAFAIVAAVAGAAGLILLSIFDTLRHPHLHDIFLIVFIAGYIISAVFICAEYQRLGIKWRDHSVLRNSFWIKLTFIFVELALAIAFGVSQLKGNTNIAAILEWVIALIYFLYVISFILDFLPAIHTKHHRFAPMSVDQAQEMGEDPNAISATGGPVYSSGGTNAYTNGGYANGYGNGDQASYGSTASMQQHEHGGRYYPDRQAITNAYVPGQVPASQNF
ncbi:hypothetical protein LTR66_004389 [Elasticomyces elasticus]|nr:hypothetical protein LTR66_004389 [Elasticomyces elasticus]